MKFSTKISRRVVVAAFSFEAFRIAITQIDSLSGYHGFDAQCPAEKTQRFVPYLTGTF